ncbi:MAG: hypothetical protein HGA61_01960, partial [Candidatus Moranbacteria bacterium]|nr:hypothetical protein [Candidatus Moranbacteria bacterium]
VKIYIDWAAGAEYVNNITNVKESVDRFPFTDEASKVKVLSAIEKKKVELES